MTVGIQFVRELQQELAYQRPVLTLATFTWDRICSDPFGIGSTRVGIYSVYTGPFRNWNSTVPYGITFIIGPIWYQIADPIGTGPV